MCRNQLLLAGLSTGSVYFLTVPSDHTVAAVCAPISKVSRPTLLLIFVHLTWKCPFLSLKCVKQLRPLKQLIVFLTAFQSSMFDVAIVWKCETSSPGRQGSISKVRTSIASTDTRSSASENSIGRRRKAWEAGKKASLEVGRTEAISAGTCPSHISGSQRQEEQIHHMLLLGGSVVEE